MSTSVAAEDLTVRIGSKTLLDGVSLSAHPGETIALVGPNGAGKSTLLRALSGEIAGSSGSARLKGQPATVYRPQELALHRAVLSQYVSVAFPFTVAEVVCMGAAGRRDATVGRQVEESLAEVDLENFGGRVISTLSGGEQQRVHFARVLVQLHFGEAARGPGILLLDEPTASLDLRHQLGLAAAARRRAADGTTVIAALHDLNLASVMADRIVILAGGRIEADGPPHQSITEEMLQTAFGVAGAVNRVPQPGKPFVLPHIAYDMALRRIVQSQCHTENFKIL
jgi:iron complex transport system ATP-binding protein